ncbi:terminase family protein [Thermotoga sp.]|uniref:terminase large subunit domain-containing protein n=1 Tax=Thermotoga sp. TaxID=28240 RepID=UPI0025E753C2|nr:terminase family protein [Thermotoga sp.]MCD6551018.1 terminase family protein [Thermotoga sp.]
MNKEQFLGDIGFKPHPGQYDAFMSDARFKILCNGRRWGKSLYSAIEILPYVFMKEKRVWIVGPTYELAQKVFREVYKYVRPRKFLWEANGRCVNSKSEMRIITNLGTEIVGKSADNPDSLIGEGLDLLIVDEAARIKEEVWNEALRPTLSDRSGRAIIISTPKGRNWFFRMWTRGKDPNFPEYQSWQHPSSENPYLKPEEIEEARRTLPERAFRQEFLAEFLDDTGGVFRGVRKNIKKTLRDPKSGEFFYKGVDLAKYMDFTVICVLDQNGDLVHFERFNQINWSLQMERIKQVDRKYPGSTWIDSTGVGDPIFEDLRRQGLSVESFKFNHSSKEQLINKLALAIEQGTIHYEDIPELVNELEIFEYQISSSGNLKMNAPPGYHDDCVIALALAVWGMGNNQTVIGGRLDIL